MAITSLFSNNTATLVITDKRQLGEQTLSGIDSSGVDDVGSVLLDSSNSAVQSTDTTWNYEVHFNPNQVQLLVSAEQDPAQDMASINSTNPTAETQRPTVPSVVLTTRLIFDHVVNADAFISDTLIPSITGVIGAAVTTSGNTHTVRDEIEALLATMYFQTTREVRFVWGDFSFAGTLTYMNSQYTMFNSAGDPIRAEAVIRITQNAGGAVLADWQKQYEATFGSVNDLSTLADSVSSVLNISI